MKNFIQTNFYWYYPLYSITPGVFNHLQELERWVRNLKTYKVERGNLYILEFVYEHVHNF